MKECNVKNRAKGLGLMPSEGMYVKNRAKGLGIDAK